VHIKPSPSKQRCLPEGTRTLGLEPPALSTTKAKYGWLRPFTKGRFALLAAVGDMVLSVSSEGVSMFGGVLGGPWLEFGSIIDCVFVFLVTVSGFEWSLVYLEVDEEVKRAHLELEMEMEMGSLYGGFCFHWALDRIGITLNTYLMIFGAFCM
jgi:hypothetical protein